MNTTITIETAEDEEDYSNSRPLDVHTWSDHPEVNVFVDLIYEQLGLGLGHQKTVKKLLKVVLLDLYVVWSADPSLKIMFSRDNNSYKAKSRYSELHIGKKIMSVVDALVASGVINEKRGFNDRVSGVGFQSRVWPTQALIEHFRAARFSVFDVGYQSDREALVLRGNGKKNIEYDDTSETKRMRKLLSDYNDVLSSTHVSIFDLEHPVLEIGSGRRKSRLQISQQNKFVTRVFNQSRWDKGGRFYGGWWQRSPKEYRKRIALDDIPSAEIDYSGLHISILYGQEGIDYWGTVNVDPYELEGISQIPSEVDLRQAAKNLLLMAINAEDGTKAFQAFRANAAAGSMEKKLNNDQIGHMLSALKEKHEPIAHKLASGAGIDLMFTDSQITEKLIERFVYHYQCPILTVHDSYIVPYFYDVRLKDEMETVFAEVVGTSASLKHTTDYYYEMERELTPEEALQHNPPHFCQRHKDEWQLFREFKGKPEGAEWIPDWTMLY